MIPGNKSLHVVLYLVRGHLVGEVKGQYSVIWYQSSHQDNVSYMLKRNRCIPTIPLFDQNIRHNGHIPPIPNLPETLKLAGKLRGIRE